MSSHPDNEPILGYRPGSAEKEALLEEMNEQMERVSRFLALLMDKKIYTLYQASKEYKA